MGRGILGAGIKDLGLVWYLGFCDQSSGLVGKGEEIWRCIGGWLPVPALLQHCHRPPCPLPTPTVCITHLLFPTSKVLDISKLLKILPE